MIAQDEDMAEVDFTTNGSDAQFGDSQEGYEVMEGAGNAGGDANPGDKINASKNDDDERYCSTWLPRPKHQAWGALDAILNS